MSKAQTNGETGGNNTLEKNIKEWVNYDNELKILHENTKEIRNKKNELEDKILSFVENNNMDNAVINISDGRLKFVETKQTAPITLTFLDQCLSEVIANKTQVEQIMNYIKKKRETKMVPEIKRYYNS